MSSINERAMDSNDLVLGIDGGATKTVACLARRGTLSDPVCVGRGTAGPSNIQAIGAQEALANLDRTIVAAFADAGVQPDTVAAAVLGLAGSDREENQRTIRQWADQRRLAHRLAVVHDALPVLAAGSPQGWGVALIGGTGSFAFGRSRDGRTCRAGGWGFLFGDEGSAYAIAVAGLRAAAQSADGRGPATRLLADFLRRWDLAEPLALIPAAYGIAADRAAIASLAEVVTAAAEAGDAVARKILERAADDLAAVVAAVARRLGISAASFPLALTGGLILSNEPLRAAVTERLRGLGTQPNPIALVADPVLGAVRLAMQEHERGPRSNRR
jgi:N-acetylmuramic acid 6-phosphate etherase